MAARKKVTMQMIADAVGVSIATISHVFNHSRFVDPNLRKEILDCAEKLGYIQKHRIQRNKLKSGAHIGLIISDIRDSDLFLDIIKISESIAREYGYTLLIGDAENSPEKEAELVQNFIARQVHGLLIASCSPSAEALEEIQGFGKLPVVLIDRKWQGNQYEFVGIDNYRASSSLTQQFIQKGLKRIGFLGLDVHTSTMRDRENGCRVAMLEAGLSQHYGSCSLDLLEDTHKQILDFCYGAARTKPQYEAIICFSTNICCDFLAALKSEGHSPENFEIATYDDSPWLEFLGFPLTVVRQPATEISVTAVNLLMEKIHTLFKRQEFSSPQSNKSEGIKPISTGKEIFLPIEIIRRELWTWRS